MSSSAHWTAHFSHVDSAPPRIVFWPWGLVLCLVCSAHLFACAVHCAGTVEWDEFLRLMKRYLKRRAANDEDEEFREAFTVCVPPASSLLLCSRVREGHLQKSGTRAFRIVSYCFVTCLVPSIASYLSSFLECFGGHVDLTSGWLQADFSLRAHEYSSPPPVLRILIVSRRVSGLAIRCSSYTTWVPGIRTGILSSTAHVIAGFTTPFESIEHTGSSASVGSWSRTLRQSIQSALTHSFCPNWMCI